MRRLVLVLARALSLRPLWSRGRLEQGPGELTGTFPACSPAVRVQPQVDSDPIKTKINQAITDHVEHGILAKVRSLAFSPSRLGALPRGRTDATQCRCGRADPPFAPSLPGSSPLSRARRTRTRSSSRPRAESSTPRRTATVRAARTARTTTTRRRTRCAQSLSSSSPLPLNSSADTPPPLPPSLSLSRPQPTKKVKGKKGAAAEDEDE